MYGGIWNVNDAPERNGLFINVITEPVISSLAGAAGIVGIAGTSEWGPHEEIVYIRNNRQALETFGPGPLQFAINQALQGPGVDQRAGALEIKAYRIVGSAADRADVTLDNDANEPDPGITISAKYVGTYGNSLNVTTQVNAINANNMDLLIYEGTRLLETYTFEAENFASLAANVNANSKFVNITVLDTSGEEALEIVANQPLTGGASGTPDTNDHAKVRNVFEANPYMDAFALDNIAALSSPIVDAYRNWTVRLNEEGKPFHLVVGGLANEVVGTALTRSVDMDTPDLIHDPGIGVGDVVVNITRDLIINGTTYSSSQLAPRVAGIIASANHLRSISGTPIAGAQLANPPGTLEVETLVRGHVVPFVMDGTTVRLDRGRTTYGAAVPPTPQKAKQFTSLLFVRKLWYTFFRIAELNSREFTGQPIANTESQRGAILDRFDALLAELEAEGTTVEGAFVQLDESQDNSDETLHLLFGYRPAPGIEQILAIVTIPV